MTPNWFIGFPVEVSGLHLPPAPPGVRVFEAADLHVTLGFLGSVQESRARDAWGLVDGFSSFGPVSGSFERVRPLGNPARPSALSAIVQDGREALSQMIVEARGPLLTAADAKQDDRPPLPHMTVARVQRRAKAAQRRDALRWADGIDPRSASFTVAAVALYTWSKDRQARLFEIVERLELSQ